MIPGPIPKPIKAYESIYKCFKPQTDSVKILEQHNHMLSSVKYVIFQPNWHPLFGIQSSSNEGLLCFLSKSTFTLNSWIGNLLVGSVLRFDKCLKTRMISYHNEVNHESISKRQ